jgi:Protein of unknown function (DUF2974)
MAISKELFLAILSMDAYNRGYDAGIGPRGTGLGLTGRIGNANIGDNSRVLDQVPDEGRAAAASFYAQSYTLNGETIIAYRGTDDPFFDACNAFGVAVGSPYGVQARLAVEFYQSVAGANPRTANVTLTGHSLG